MNLIFMLIDKVQCFENVTLILLIVFIQYEVHV